MKIFVEKDYNSMSQRAFSLFMKFLPETRVLGLATGNSPLGLYGEISRAYADERLSLKGIHTFNLDEYFGIEEENPESYHSFMKEHLFSRVDISAQNVHFPETGGDPVAITAKYDRELDEIGHPDLQILGIGQNGHIAFNEPGSPRLARTRVVKLTHNTIEVNKPPSEFAVTMGLKDILMSRRIILLASGKSKADAVSRMVDGPMGYGVPASYIQEHPEAFIVLDIEAASKIDQGLVEKRIRASEELGFQSYYFDL